jgi:transposase
MRFDLSDKDWALLEPLLPKGRKSARVDDRKCDLLRSADRNAVAGSAGTLWPLHDGL